MENPSRSFSEFRIDISNLSLIQSHKFADQSIKTPSKSLSLLSMDTKSLARSKRAHSNQHKRTHPHQKPKSQPIAVPSDPNSKNPPGKQNQEKPRQFRGSSSALPSNWDRYEDEFDTTSESSSVEPKGQAADVVHPKSKGADFSYLISEAQSQLESRRGVNSGNFTSFDDVLPDFNQGVSSMLSVRGNGILSWIGDDNFIVDDNSTSGYEESFLSMDLHALAAQLAKLDVSKRLFIEEDILPPELRSDRTKETGSPESGDPGHLDLENNDKSCKSRPSTMTASHDPLQAYPHQEAILVDQISDDLQFSTINSSNSVPIFRCHGDELINKVKGEQTADISVVDSVPAVDTRGKMTSNFEAIAAETELDMLLNSFEETNLDSGSSMKSTNILPATQSHNSTSVPLVYASRPLNQAPNSSEGMPLDLNLNDKIDELLQETSHPKNSMGPVPPPAHVPSSSSSQTTAKVVLDDFDSWLDTI